MYLSNKKNVQSFEGEDRSPPQTMTLLEDISIMPQQHATFYRDDLENEISNKEPLNGDSDSRVETKVTMTPLKVDIYRDREQIVVLAQSDEESVKNDDQEQVATPESKSKKRTRKVVMINNQDLSLVPSEEKIVTVTEQ